MTLKHGLHVASALIVASSVQLLGQSPRPTPSPLAFYDNFEAERGWQTFEELVEPFPECYATGLGEVKRTMDAAVSGAWSLSVHAKQDPATLLTNHLLARKKIASTGRTGIWRYQVHAYIDPDPQMKGEAGPEFSMQNTRPTPAGNRTTTVGIQYQPNPFLPDKHRLALWARVGEGMAAWVVFKDGLPALQTGVWYELEVRADYTNNRYISFRISGPGLDLPPFDLSSYSIAEENKGFEPAFEITLESEPQSNNCGVVGPFEYRVYYDDVSLDTFQNDLAIDFGDLGLWGLYNNGPNAPLQAGLPAVPTTELELGPPVGMPFYAPLHTSNPEEMTNGDVDGNGLDELIADFPGSGVWVWRNNMLWHQLHTANVRAITTGDLDDNGQADVVLDFPAVGTWMYLNDSSWAQLHPLSPTRLMTGDLDGNGKAEVILDFAGLGVWVWFNNTAWVQLHTSNVDGVAVGDLDGSGQSDAVLDFPGFGLWTWSNNAAWAQLHPVNPDLFTTGDVDGNGQDDVILDFPGFGLWVRLNNTSWAQLHSLQAEDLLTADLDASGQADVIIDFGSPGLWAWVNNSQWIALHALSPEGLAGGSLDGS